MGGAGGIMTVFGERGRSGTPMGLWAPSIAVCNSPTYWSPSGCPVFPGLPNISFAGNPISLPSIIILGVYPVLLFTEDLNVPTDCGRY
jgi:hypothetical protein